VPETGEARSVALDQFRGFAIISMVAANFLAGIASVPAWFRHAPDSGLTFVDLIAPFFILAMAIGFGPSLRSRVLRDCPVAACAHFAKRFLALIALGFLINLGADWMGVGEKAFNWGVLHALGFAGLVCLPFMRLPWPVKAGLSLAGLAAYQGLSSAFLGDGILALSHGGVPGAFSWACMLLLGSAVADAFRARRREIPALAISGAALLAAGVALSFLAPISKNRVSASYVLVSLGAGLLIYLGFRLLEGPARRKIPLLGPWGRNPLIFYLMHYVLMAVWVLPRLGWWYADAPLWLGIAELAAILAVISAAAVILDKKKIYLSL
jgi:predicted acyltransferase